MAENRQVRQKHMHRRALRCELPGESGAIGEDYHVHYGMARANLKNAVQEGSERTGLIVVAYGGSSPERPSSPVHSAVIRQLSLFSSRRNR